MRRGGDYGWRDTCLVLIILRNAPIDVIRVTMCALPVQQSVTVITGQENVRNSSNDSKNTPHDRSYLKGIHDQLSAVHRGAWTARTTGCCAAGSVPCRPSTPVAALSRSTPHAQLGALTDWRSYSQPFGSTKLKSDMTKLRLLWGTFQGPVLFVPLSPHCSGRYDPSRIDKSPPVEFIRSFQGV